MLCFYSVIKEIVSKHAPVKEERIKYDTEPKWFYEDIKMLIRERDKCHKSRQFDAYKILRNKVTSAIKKKQEELF